MDNFLPRTTSEKYFFPLLVVIFFIAHHYYSFYEDDFKKIFAYVSPIVSKNQYAEVQAQHPYYQVYKLAKEVKDPEKNIIYVRTRVDPKNKVFLHELTIMIGYFFYPKNIRSYSLSEFKALTLENSQIVIADTDLAPYITDKPFIKQLWFPPAQLKRINRWPEDAYFTYSINK